MGEFATAVQERICRHLRCSHPTFDWETERRIAGTPVDVAGDDGERLVVVELEWRRADPADNAAKLFRHLVAGDLGADRVAVIQLFSAYYDLASGGVSAKRRNAEFVGEVAADHSARLRYEALDLDVDPPKRGGSRPGAWASAVDAVADRIADDI